MQSVTIAKLLRDFCNYTEVKKLLSIFCKLFKVTSAGFHNYIDSEFKYIIVKNKVTQLQSRKIARGVILYTE
jgi:hypothetical protein